MKYSLSIMANNKELVCSKKGAFDKYILLYYLDKIR